MEQQQKARYRLLTDDDGIKDGDEALSSDCETWEPVDRELIGKWHSSYNNGAIRRRIEEHGAFD